LMLGCADGTLLREQGGVICSASVRVGFQKGNLRSSLLPVSQRDWRLFIPYKVAALRTPASANAHAPHGSDASGAWQCALEFSETGRPPA
jgi:hypothetical protein